MASSRAIRRATPGSTSGTSGSSATLQLQFPAVHRADLRGHRHRRPVAAQHDAGPGCGRLASGAPARRRPHVQPRLPGTARGLRARRLPAQRLPDASPPRVVDCRRPHGRLAVRARTKHRAPEPARHRRRPRVRLRVAAHPRRPIPAVGLRVGRGHRRGRGPRSLPRDLLRDAGGVLPGRHDDPDHDRAAPVPRVRWPLPRRARHPAGSARRGRRQHHLERRLEVTALGLRVVAHTLYTPMLALTVLATLRVVWWTHPRMDLASGAPVRTYAMLSAVGAVAATLCLTPWLLALAERVSAGRMATPPFTGATARRASTCSPSSRPIPCTRCGATPCTAGSSGCTRRASPDTHRHSRSRPCS